TQHEVQLLRDFSDLLALPNLASDTVNIRRNADAISAELRKRGMKTQLLTVPGAPPLVFGELPTQGATQTLLFYAHYDGQPVDASEGKTPPWSPVLRSGTLESGAAEVPLETLRAPVDPGWFIYARSAGDDKAPIAALLGALDALAAGGIPRSVNLKVLL